MKKTYITPEALTVCLAMNSNLLQNISGHDQVADDPEGQYTKEHLGNGNSSIGGGKSIWDEEW